VQSLSNATVTITNNGTTDGLTVSTPTCTFHLGMIVPGDYVGGTAGFTATFTSSTLSWDPTTKRLTITIGTLGVSTATITTNVTAVAPKYTPVTSLTDLAGNAMVATQFTDITISGF
jgi:hypothetical protein